MNKKQQTQDLANVVAKPTIYTFNFNDVPIEKYAETLSVLFRHPEYKAMVEKRNRFVEAASRSAKGSSVLANLVRQIEKQDRQLADVLLSSVVQTNLHSNEEVETLSFTHLLKYFVDYSKEDASANVRRLTAQLYQLTFLADMLESLLLEIRDNMDGLFGHDIQFQQFDAVLQVLKHLGGYFQSVRPQESESKEAQLYMDYADSINDYLEKRLKTYSEKITKFRPLPTAYTQEDMILAINQFFVSGKRFGHNFIKHTESGGAYIDAVALAFNLDNEQTEKLDRLVGKRKSRDVLSYCLAVTDGILLHYNKPK